MRPSARLAMILTLLAAAACGGAPRPRSVVLISIDTLRADHLGCYGAPGQPSPNIDRLAARGVRFEHAFSSVPLTTPSHAAIFTGQQPTWTRVRLNGYDALPNDRTTLAEMLAARGYQTAGFVGGFPLDSSFGLAQGFESYDDDLDPAEKTHPGLEDRRAQAVIDRALAWFSRRDPKRPYFLFVHCFDPHAPYLPPEPYRTRFADRYTGEIAYTDAQVGRLLEALGAEPLVVLLGDHGEARGEHGEETHGIFVYDATLRVPLILAGTGLPSGRTASDEAALVDVVPTVLGQLGLALPTNLHGVDLTPALQGQKLERRLPIYGESMRPRTPFDWAPLRSLRDHGTKYILAPREELYETLADPREAENRIAFDADRARELRRALKKLQAAITPPEGERTHSAKIDEAAAAKLRSLGYATGPAGKGADVDPLSLPDPKDRIALVNAHAKAQEEEAERRPERAIEIYRELLTRYPTEHWLRLDLARTLLRVGRSAEILPLLDPPHLAELSAEQLVRALTYRAAAFGEAGQFPRALAEWDALEALGGSGKAAALHGKKGLLSALVRAGQLELALPALEAAVKVHDDEELRRLLAEARAAH